MDAQKSIPKLEEASLHNIEHLLVSPALERQTTLKLLRYLTTRVLDEVSLFTCYISDNHYPFYVQT